MTAQKEIARRLIDVAGETYASQTGIRLADKPSPLYQLLVLSVLLSAPMKADIGVAAGQELFKAKMKTPRKMLDATWQQRVDALGKGHYVRYDESTATALGEGAQLLLDKYGGDLRKLRQAADGDVDKLRELLQEVPRLGPVGAHIFCREAQAIWPELQPYLDRKALDGADKVGLPTDTRQLARLAGKDLARLAAGLVRVGLDKRLAKEVNAA
ncbi:endonuclease [Kibdelosporangium philippinense]|uniref:Endonuclease n=2 Tax=Kibdelosporangium philippinense TaxID=211113 RepID=A0ABS8ZUK6_9PSEU|nr:endonuclease [Kibdelosporangium philippinense]